MHGCQQHMNMKSRLGIWVCGVLALGIICCSSRVSAARTSIDFPMLESGEEAAAAVTAALDGSAAGGTAFASTYSEWWREAGATALHVTRNLLGPYNTCRPRCQAVCQSAPGLADRYASIGVLCKATSCCA